jgi:tetratricopeptide (TPR) repeat protein
MIFVILSLGLAGASPALAGGDGAKQLAVQPTAPEDFLARGDELMRLGRLKEALADFDKALELSPTWSAAHADRAVALVQLGKLDQAKVSLDTALILEADDARVWEGYGVLYLAQDRPADAVDALTRSLALAPGISGTLGKRSIAYEQLGKLPEALADVEAALRDEPESSALTLARARLLQALGRREDSLNASARLLELESRNPSVQAFYALQLERAGRAAEAAKAWRAAIGEADRQIAAAKGADEKRGLRLTRVQLLADSGDLAGAIRTLDAMDREQPDSAPILSLRCWIRATANRELERALKDCKRAQSIDPGNGAVADRLGFLNLRLARLEEAVVELSKSIEWAPRQAASRFARGLARLRKGDREGGEADLRAARRLDFDIDHAFARLGMAPPQDEGQGSEPAGAPAAPSAHD